MNKASLFSIIQDTVKLPQLNYSLIHTHAHTRKGVGVCEALIKHRHTMEPNQGPSLYQYINICYDNSPFID